MVSNEWVAFNANYKKHIDGEMMSYYLGWKGDTCNQGNQGCARGIKKGWNN